MNRKNIFKTLAAAMLMPAMLLTTSCSSDDDALNAPAENIAKKGYTIPVTVNVTRQGDDATTRATYTYDEYTKKGTLAFSAGDKLFVSGSYNDYENVFAGTLDYVSDGTFSGTITTETEWTGTIDELLADAVAQLLSAGYESYGYLSITENNGYDAEFANDRSKAITTSKATAVEQFSLEQGDYDSDKGFELESSNAILYFTITGLAASTSVAVDFTDSFAEITTSGNVTTDGDGTATFSIGIWSDSDLKDCTLSVDGNDITLVSSSKYVEAGKIYNITRSAAAAPGYTLLSAATTSDYGKVVCTAGHLHDAKTAVPDGCTAVGILGKVTETGHGLILALQDADSQYWKYINSWTSVTTYASTTLKLLPDDDARWHLTSYNTLGSTAVSNWAVAQKSDYVAIFTNLGSTAGNGDGISYDDSVNAHITTGVGGWEMSGYYWSATEYEDDDDFAWEFSDEGWEEEMKENDGGASGVRPVLAF